MLRDGRARQVAAAGLVPGDVVEVAVGGKVPADLRVAAIASSVLRADQVAPFLFPVYICLCGLNH